MNATTQATKASCYPQVHRSGNTTWVCKVGKRANGKPDLRRFPTEQEARAFAEQWNASLVSNNHTSLTNLSTASQSEIVACVSRLAEYGATIRQATDFYLQHALPPKADITIDEGIALFKQAKTSLGRRPTYVNKTEHTFFKPFSRFYPERTLRSITQHDAQAYIDAHPKWSPKSKASHIGFMRIFYNFFKRQKYCSLNPFQELEVPRAQSIVPKLMPPQNVEKLLQFLLENNKAACAMMCLSFFSAVRVEEASRLDWADVDLEHGLVVMSPTQTKMHKPRTVELSPNCIEWLKLCVPAERKGKLAPFNFEERLKRLRRKAGVAYPTNSARHCYAAYALARDKDSGKVAFQMGHPNSKLLYSTYYALVRSEQDIKAYWSIVPTSAKAAWDERAKQEAAQANLERIKVEIQKQGQL